MDLRTHLRCVVLLVLTLVAPFALVWSRGESLMAALAGPGVTLQGPVGQVAGAEPPYTDAVAAYIDEPLAALRHDLVASGQPDTWNPHNALGVPLYGNWQSSIDSPLRALVHFAPRSAWSYDATYVLRLVLAGLGAFALAWRLRVGGIGCYVAGVAFGLTGYFVRYLPMHHLNAEVLLPWLLLTCDLVQSRRRAVLALFAHVLVAWCIVVGGNPQPALVAAATAAVFALARTRQHGLASLVPLALASLPAVLLAAPYCLAGFEYVAASVHHHDATYGGDAYTPAGGLGFVVSEPFTGGGGRSLLSVVAPYFGVATLLLAAFGAGAGPLRGPLLWGLLFVFGGKLVNLPLAAWLGDVPGFAQMKIFKYGFPPAALALALLAGNGAHLLAAAPLTRRRVAAAVASVVAVAIVLFVSAHAAATRLTGLVELRSLVPALGCAGIVGLLGAVALGRVPVPRGIVAASVLVLELVIAMPRHFLPRTEPFAAPAYAKAFTARPGTARVLPMLGVLMPNQNAVFGIDALTLHDGVFPARYGALVKELVNPNVRRWPVFTGEDLGERPQDAIAAAKRVSLELLPQRVTFDVQPSVVVDFLDAVHTKIFDLCNVRYLVLPSLDVTRAWVKAWPKEAGALVHQDETALVFERRDPLPRAFFPRRTQVVAGPTEALAALRDPAFQPREVAFLEGPTASVTTVSEAASAYVETRKRATELEVSAQTATPSWLVISQSVYPGWRAEIDGKVVPLVPADLVGCAVLVPQGRHRVRLVYDPTWHTPGLALAGFGALLVLALALLAHRNATQRG